METHDHTPLFVRLFAEHNRQIYAFTRAILPHQADAEEVFQRACTVLWNKFGQFRPGTNFLAWACSVVRLEVRAFRRAQARDRLLFGEKFYQTIERQAVEMNDVLDQQHRALADCFQQLPSAQQELIRQRYESQSSVETLADALGRTPNAIYKQLRRVHERLFGCIERKLKAEEC